MRAQLFGSREGVLRQSSPNCHAPQQRQHLGSTTAFSKQGSPMMMPITEQPGDMQQRPNTLENSSFEDLSTLQCGTAGTATISISAT